MTTEEIIDTLIVTATAMGAVSVLGGTIVWTFREKVTNWVRERLLELVDGGTLDARMDARAELRMGGLSEWRSDMEERMGNQERTAERIAEALDGIATKFSEATDRQTQSMERMADKVDQNALATARIEGAIEEMRRSK